MALKKIGDVSALFLDDKLVEDAHNAAVREAVRLHEEKGLPLVVWRDGKTVWITPEEVQRAMAAKPEEGTPCVGGAPE